MDRGQDTAELESLYAEALEGQGETGKAIDAYRSAIKLDPADENNYVDFASLCIDHHAFEDGLKVLTLGLSLHPSSERLTFMLGILHASQGNVDLAEQDFQRAAQLAPQRDLGAIGLDTLYLHKGNSEQTIHLIRRQLNQKPDDANLLFLLGETLISSGSEPGQPSYTEAQHALERSVALNPDLCLPHVSLGSIYLQEDRFSDAVSQFEAARAIDPNENSAYSHLAVAYRRLGQPDKAKEVLVALQKLLEQQRSGSRVKTAASRPPS